MFMNPEIKPAQERGRNGLLRLLPRETRVSVLASRAFLTIITASVGATAIEAYQAFSANTPRVEAADPQCGVKLLVLGFRFVDNPVIPNRLGLIDPVDYALGVPEFGEVVINYQDDPKDLKSKRTEIARASMVVRDGDHAEVLLNLQPKPNTKVQNGKDAARLLVSFAEDRIRQADDSSLPVEKPIDIECGQDGLFYNGRYASQSAIDTAKNVAGVDMVGTMVDKISGQRFNGRTLGLAPAGSDRGKNLKDLLDHLPDIKARAQQVREKERGLAQTSTPTTSPTPRPATTTPTATGTPTPTRTPEASPPTPTATPYGGKGGELRPGNNPVLAWAGENLLSPLGGGAAGIALLITAGITLRTYLLRGTQALWRRIHH